jgi:hypothetical protein
LEKRLLAVAVRPKRASSPQDEAGTNAASQNKTGCRVSFTSGIEHTPLLEVRQPGKYLVSTLLTPPFTCACQDDSALEQL